jgi:phage tail-like protein
VPPERFIGYLPAIYQEDEFTRRFLRVFDHLLALVESHVAVLPHQFDPALAGPGMLAVVGTWLAGPELPPLPDRVRRLLLREFVPLWRRRGTYAGLRRVLDITIGTDAALSIRSGRGFVVGPDTTLGGGSALASSAGGTPSIYVQIPRLPSGIDAHTANMIVRAYKPAGIEHRIEIENVD